MAATMDGTSTTYSGPPLHSIMTRDNAEQLCAWWNARPAISNVIADDLLLQACRFKAPRCIRAAMVTLGANPNVRARKGLTPLMIVCTLDGAEACVDVLLSHSSTDINARNDSKQTAFHIACERGKTSIVSKLLRKPATDVNGASETGVTGLMLAAVSDAWRTTTILIQSGRVDVNATDVRGCSALHLACLCAKYPHCVKALLDSPCTAIDTQDKDGFTALMHACCNVQCQDLVPLLLNAGASVNLKDRFGRTALLLACENTCSLSIRALLTHPDTDISLTDRYGNTALMLLAEHLPDRDAAAALHAMLALPDAPVNAVNVHGESVLSMLTDWDLVPELMKRNGHLVIDPPGTSPPYAFELCMHFNRKTVARDCIMPRSRTVALLSHKHEPFVKAELDIRARWGFMHEFPGAIAKHVERAAVVRLLVLASARGFGHAVVSL